MADFGLSTGVLCGGIGGGTSLSSISVFGSPLFLCSVIPPFLDLIWMSVAVGFSCMLFLMSSLDNLVASRYTGGGGRWSSLVRFSADGVLPLILLPLSPKDVCKE